MLTTRLKNSCKDNTIALLYKRTADCELFFKTFSVIPFITMEKKRTVACTFCFKSTSRYFIKTLPCGHFTCNECHGKYAKDGCRKCRKPIPLPHTREDNEYSTYIGVTKKESYKKEGKVQKSNKFDRSCPNHGNIADFFCYSCDVPACSKCLLTTHKVREHDVASFVDFAKEVIKRNTEKLNNLETLQRKLADDISCSRTAIQKDGRKLKQIILDACKDAEVKMKNDKASLLDVLKKKDEEAMNWLSSLQDEHEDIISKILSTRKICQSIEKDLDLSSDFKKLFSLESIDKSMSEINRTAENLDNVTLPENLGLNFTAHPRGVSIGSFTIVPHDDESCYNMLRDLPTWTAEKQIDIGELNNDFSSIVCMSSDWVVHISSLQESQHIAIRHYSLNKKIASRKSMDLATLQDWTVAKDAGHDYSILLASGQNVYRISFRKIDKEIIQTFTVSFSIEAITWGEYKVDCYLLSSNLRDVHWLSMDGKVSYLCSFQTGPQSASSLTVNDDCKMHLLDPIAGNIHITSYASLDHGEKKRLLQHFPSGFKSESGLFSPRLVATRRDVCDHFVLFHYSNLLTVGKYNKKFGFLQWVIKESTDSEQNVVDISIKDDNLAMLIGAKIAMYKITPD